MKLMMVLMPIFFYKFAAGLAIYFIISTGWGIAERKLVPKPDPSASGGAGGGDGGHGGPGADPEPPKPKGWLARKLQEARDRIEEMKKRADEESKRQIRNEPGEEQGQPGQSRQELRLGDGRGREAQIAGGVLDQRASPEARLHRVDVPADDGERERT